MICLTILFFPYGYEEVLPRDFIYSSLTHFSSSATMAFRSI